MPKKMIVYKKMLREGSHKPVLISLRQVQVSDSFIGISKKGEVIKSEFMKLAEDLEASEGLHIDILSV